MPSLFGGRAPLQPNGPAPFTQPSDRDRRALFWWLKRNTSYTAIAHNAALWAQAMAAYERWLRTLEAPSESRITALKYGLDTQLKYERGLERLKRGDHSVFNHTSSQGWLGKLNTAGPGTLMNWFDPPVEFVSRVSGIPLETLQAYLHAHDAAMAVSHQGAYRGLDYIDVNVYVHASRVISARPLLDALPFDTALPEPRWDVSFKPGSRAPKDGIYEQVDAQGHIVGGMEYFVKSQTTEADDGLEFGPLCWEATHQTTSSFLWRLLWEDTRYKDGKIPEEEQHYPTPSESVATQKAAEANATMAASLRCESGQPCPREGWWSTPAKPDSRRRFSAGEVMPSLGGDYGVTIWQWDERQD